MAQPKIISQLSILPNLMLTSTLAAGETTITFNNSQITSISDVDVYINNKEVTFTNIIISDGQITIEFEPLEEDVEVKVKIRIN